MLTNDITRLKRKKEFTFNPAIANYTEEALIVIAEHIMKNNSLPDVQYIISAIRIKHQKAIDELESQQVKYSQLPIKY